jgi:GNAT superfamily N-acetyltransferase
MSAAAIPYLCIVIPPGRWVLLTDVSSQRSANDPPAAGREAKENWRMQELSITPEENPDAAAASLVRNMIYQHNRSVGKSDYQPLTLLLRNAVGEVVGGLLGKTEWGWLHVDAVAIREEWRGRGYGTKLLAMAEAEWRARGCHDVYLDTFSFQARPFYERPGYEVFGVLENFTQHTKYFLRKKLCAR